MTDYIVLDNQCISEMQTCNTSIMQSLEAINAAQDSTLFIQLVNRAWVEAPNFLFEAHAESDKVRVLVYLFFFFSYFC